MKKMKLTKKNKRELKAISAVLILFAIVFLWIVQTIGLPIETYIDRGKIKVIDVSSYNGTVNWKKVKDQKINHAMLKIGSGIDQNKKEARTVDSVLIFAMQGMHQSTEVFIIILMRRQHRMRRKKQSIV